MLCVVSKANTTFRPEMGINVFFFYHQVLNSFVKMNLVSKKVLLRNRHKGQGTGTDLISNKSEQYPALLGKIVYLDIFSKHC